MHETREAWLIEATKHLRPWFEQEEAPLPNIQVSIGVQPGATTLATCYMDDKEPGDPEYTSNIYVTPAVDPEEPTRLLDILLHEMVHAANHFQGINGHGKEFGAIARALGLTGKMTATVASEELKERLAPIAEVLGPFPHKVMDLAGRGLGPGGKKKQTTRMVKAQCTECTYTVRLSRKWIEVALPICPNVDCGAYQHEMLVDDV
jgi:hypothetical protein